MTPRVVSLLPSATEIICGVGGFESLAGVSHECDYPPQVAGLPVLTRARLPSRAASSAIDQAVRDVVRAALAVYDIDTDMLAQIRPDVIVTQDLCDVCAVAFTDVCAAVRKLARSDVGIVRLHPMRLDDIWNDIRTTAKAIGRERQGEASVTRLVHRVEAVRSRAAKAPWRPRVVTVEWIEPVMLGGLWMADLVDIACGVPLGSAPGIKAVTMDLEALAQLEPDVVLIKPCGYKLEQSLKERGTLKRTLPWEAWPAVREARVYIADGNAYFNRPGPRIVDSLEILAACLHPGLFPEFREVYRNAVVRIHPDLRAETW